MNKEIVAKKERLKAQLASLEEDLVAAEDVRWGIMKAIKAKQLQIERIGVSEGARHERGGD